MVDHEQLEENLSLYALGTLEPDAAREVASHLAAGCPRCSALVRQYQGTAAMLPYALPLNAPPAELKAKVMRAIAGQDTPIDAPAAAPSTEATLELPPAKPFDKPAPLSPLPSLIGRPAGWSLALAASFGALFLGISGYAYHLYTTLQAEQAAHVGERTAITQANLKASDLERKLDERQRALDKATLELNRTVQALGTTHDLLAKNQEQLEVLQSARPGKSTEEIARIFSSPSAKMADLHGTDMAKNAYALVFMEPDTRRGFFYANNLPELPAGKTYQLWIITDRPVSVGVFSLDRGHKGRMMLQNMPEAGKIQKFAVSMEPAGGRPQPTGSIHLVGDLQH